MHSGHKNELLINDWGQFHEVTWVYTQTIWHFKKILFPIAILFDLIVTRLVMDRFENLEIIQNSRKKWKFKLRLLIHIHYLKEIPWTENPNSVYRSITIKYIVISKFREQKKQVECNCKSIFSSDHILYT